MTLDNIGIETQTVQPSAREIAAARAARIRLGYEDGDIDSVPQAAPKEPSGVAPVAVDVPYYTREEIEPLEQPEIAAQELGSRLQTTDWVSACGALKDARALALHSPGIFEAHATPIFQSLLKSVKSPRSQLCKSAMLCVQDIIFSCPQHSLDHFDTGGMSKPGTSMLVNVLLKGANDKKFVQEAAINALLELSKVPQEQQLQVAAMLLPYLQHKNPKVRALAASTFVACIESSGRGSGLSTGDIVKAGAKLVVDNTPEARESGRQLLFVASRWFSEGGGDGGEADVVMGGDEKENSGENGTNSSSGEQEQQLSEWEQFCKNEVGATAFLAIRKVVSS